MNNSGIKVFKLDDCDFVVAYDEQSAREWYERTIINEKIEEAIEYPLDTTMTAGDPGDTLDPGRKTTFAAEIQTHLASGGVLPFIVASDGSYA